MFRVVWSIDIDAPSAYEAATKALAIHRDGTSLATVFDVTDALGVTVQIDLENVYNVTE